MEQPAKPNVRKILDTTLTLLPIRIEEANIFDNYPKHVFDILSLV